MASKVTLKFHVGGIFTGDPPKLAYSEGLTQDVTDIDVDHISYSFIESLIIDSLCYPSVSTLWYRIPEVPLNLGGLRVLYNDESVFPMIPIIMRDGIIDIYAEHVGGIVKGKVSEVTVLSGAGESSGNQHISNEGEDINYNYEEDEEFANPLYDEYMSDADDEEVQTIRKHVRGTQDGKEDELLGLSHGDATDFGVGIREILGPSLEHNDVDADGVIEDGDGLEYWDSSDCGSFTDTDEEGDDASRKKSSFPTFCRYSLKPEFEVSMTFRSRSDAKHAITLYAVKHQREVKIYKNDSTRIKAKCCLEACPWKISIIFDNGKQHYQVKAYVDRHTCSTQNKNKMVTAGFLAKHYYRKIKAAPTMKLREMKEFVKEDLRVEVSTGQCRRAKVKVKARMEGSYRDEYNKLWDYAEELRRSNDGSSIFVNVERNDPMKNPQFKRFYVCLDACRRGFLGGCRKIFGLDGCFLKGPCKGELLSAIGKDANNQMYPIAWAVVEVEFTDSWTWFLNNLKHDLGLANGSGWSIMSDQQKGLIRAVEDILPLAEHRMCGRHIYANWRKKHKPRSLQINFWRCARSTTVSHFDRALKDLEQITKEGAEDLLKTHPRHWCRAYFGTEAKCDMVDNNISETFNGWILDARHRSIIAMLDEIRVKVMTRIEKNNKLGLRWGDFCPRIMAKLEKMKEESAFCHLDWNGSAGYEVRHGVDRFVVNMEAQSCSCRAWDISGIPCPHAICAIYHRNENPEIYLSYWYKKETYMKTYTCFLEPVNGPLLWPKTGLGGIEPPHSRIMPGRPKLKRRREEAEGKSQGRKMSRVGMIMTCRNCKGVGHNSRSCKGQGSKGNGQQNKGQTSRGRGMRGGRGPARGRKERGFGLYCDMNSGALTWNPGRQSEVIVSEGRAGSATQGSATIDDVVGTS